MKVPFRLILLLVIQLLLLSAPLAAGLAVSKLPDQLAQLDAYMKEGIAASGIPGGGYALVKDGNWLVF